MAIINELPNTIVSVDDNAIVTMDISHSRIHRGDYFNFSNYLASVSNNGVFTTLFITGLYDCHVVFEITTIGTFQSEIYESPSVSNNGTEIAIHSHNRNSNYRETTSKTYTTPTFTNGTIIRNRYIVAGNSGNNRATASLRTGSEYVLKANTKYIFRLTNRSGASQEMAMHVEFYEDK